MGNIATQQEWEYAKKTIEKYKDGKTLHSGFKLDRKKHSSLKHSFVYFYDESKKEDKLVCLAKHYHLGAGGFGTVKITEDEEGKLYALKIQKNEIKENEKEVLSKLNYLHFVGQKKSLNSTSTEENKFYLLEKWFDGITLDEYLESTVLTKEQKMSLAYYIVKSVHELHHFNKDKKETIIHGDLYPNNFIINIAKEKSSLTPIDFGGSQVLKENQNFYKGYSCGVLDYRAPEATSYKNDAILSEKSDVFSLGILLKKDLGLELDIVDQMCEKFSGDRPTLETILDKLKPENLIQLPAQNLEKRLFKKYGSTLDNLSTSIKTKISSILSLSVSQGEKFLIQDGKEYKEVLQKEKSNSYLFYIDSENPNDIKKAVQNLLDHKKVNKANFYLFAIDQKNNLHSIYIENNKVNELKTVGAPSYYGETSEQWDGLPSVVNKLKQQYFDNTMLHNLTWANVRELELETNHSQSIASSVFAFEKYKNSSLKELVSIYYEKNKSENFSDEKITLKEIKTNLLEAIQAIVKLTNNIDELHSFFVDLKKSENKDPFLRKECGFYSYFQTNGITTSWQEAIKIFKTRAMELAHEQHDLKQEFMDKKMLFQEIFAEKRVRSLVTQEPKSLTEFNKISELKM